MCFAIGSKHFVCWVPTKTRLESRFCTKEFNPHMVLWLQAQQQGRNQGQEQGRNQGQERHHGPRGSAAGAGHHHTQHVPNTTAGPSFNKYIHNIIRLHAMKQHLDSKCAFAICISGFEMWFCYLYRIPAPWIPTKPRLESGFYNQEV